MERERFKEFRASVREVVKRMTLLRSGQFPKSIKAQKTFILSVIF